MELLNVQESYSVDLIDKIEHFSTAPKGILKVNKYNSSKYRIKKSLTTLDNTSKRVSFADQHKNLPLCTVFEVDVIKFNHKKKENVSCTCLVF